MQATVERRQQKLWDEINTLDGVIGHIMLTGGTLDDLVDYLRGVRNDKLNKIKAMKARKP